MVLENSRRLRPSIVVTVLVSVAAVGISSATRPAAAAAIQDRSMTTDDGHQAIRLWSGVAPGSEGWTQQEVAFGNPGARGVRNVVDPTVTVFLPDPATSTGAGVITQNDPISNKSAPALFAAWTPASKPAEIHIYQQGGHGFGTRPRNQPVDWWLDRFVEWLRSQKLAN
jgi:hypothetical protein